MPMMPESARSSTLLAAAASTCLRVIVVAGVLAAVSPLSSCTKKREVRRERASPTSSQDRYSQHLRELRARVPEGFTVVVQEPFVVIGDEPEQTVERRAHNLVKWSVDVLKAEYFDKDPDPIVDIWLMRDDASYQQNTLRLTGRLPATRFGFYSATHAALLMNIDTGGGTLVHEVVHAFMRTNFPGCPVWLNEGLGSLYEASEDANGRPRGLLNWRLPGLQKVIKDELAPTLREVVAMDDAAFYGAGAGANYAVARYLLYYLQEQGRLQRLWRDIRENRAQDPTGFGALQRAMEQPNWSESETRWRAWVLTLRWQRA
jgi:hypothetical protein